MKIDVFLLRYFSESLGWTDSAIAAYFKTTRTAVVHARKKHQLRMGGIPGEAAVSWVNEQLISLGFKTVNAKTENKTAEFDLLLEASPPLRISVISTSFKDSFGYFKFVLTDPPSSSFSRPYARIPLPNGRFRKNFEVTSDFIILVGQDSSDCFSWIIPSSSLPPTLQTLSLSPTSKSSKYMRFMNAWGLLQRKTEDIPPL